MARVKVSDLTNVRGWTVPLLRTSGSNVVHISRQYGYVSGDGLYATTDCGITLKYSWTYQQSLTEWEGRLCPRCGDWEDFEAVRQEYLESKEEYEQEQENEIEREMREHEAQMAEMSLRLSKLTSFLSFLCRSGDEGFSGPTRISNGDGYVRAVRFEYGGKAYEIQEIEE